MTRRHATLAASALALLALLAAAWLALPALMLERFHRVAADMGGGHHGEAARVELHPGWPGYALHEVRVVRDGIALLQAKRIAVRFGAAEAGSGVDAHGLRLDLAAGTPPRLGAGIRWRHFLDGLAPHTVVDRVRAHDATLAWRFAAGEEPVLELDRLQATLDGLARQPDDARPAPALLQLRGRLLDHAALDAQARFDPQGPMQRLNLQARVREVELPRLRPLVQRWQRVDFAGGRADVDLRLLSEAGRVHGTVATALHDVDVFDWQQDVRRDRDGLLGAARELLAGGAVALRRRGDAPLRREHAIARRIELPDDNGDGLRAVLEAGIAEASVVLREP